MDGSVTMHVGAPSEQIWGLVSDVRNMGGFKGWLDAGGETEKG